MLNTMTHRPEAPQPLDPDTAWTAVVERDARFDGRFVYAVGSTGIYCRPTCPSRRPRQSNVRFFAVPEEAERAGGPGRARRPGRRRPSAAPAATWKRTSKRLPP
jgi:AraC family transcriptional regulator, regulatory protein of adaptative response / methylated-DNA-[protein]-cysteine methyltransferase